VQAARDVLIGAGRELGVRPQRDALELPSAVRLISTPEASSRYATTTIPA
jgi:hypothetical protein